MAGIIPAPIKQLVRTTDGSTLLVGPDAAGDDVLVATGPGAAEWRKVAVSPNGGTLGDPAAAISALLDALPGVDTSGVHDWTKGLNVPVVAPNGANFGTGYHVRYSDGTWAAVTYARGTTADWSTGGPLDPLNRGATDNNYALYYLTGAAAANPYPPLSIFMAFTRTSADAIKSAGGSFAFATNTGAQFSLLAKTGTFSVKFDRIEIKDGVTGALIDWDYQK